MESPTRRRGMSKRKERWQKWQIPVKWTGRPEGLRNHTSSATVCITYKITSSPSNIQTCSVLRGVMCYPSTWGSDIMALHDIVSCDSTSGLSPNKGGSLQQLHIPISFSCGASIGEGKGVQNHKHPLLLGAVMYPPWLGSQGRWPAGSALVIALDTLLRAEWSLMYQSLLPTTWSCLSGRDRQRQGEDSDLRPNDALPWRATRLRGRLFMLSWIFSPIMVI